MEWIPVLRGVLVMFEFITIEAEQAVNRAYPNVPILIFYDRRYGTFGYTIFPRIFIKADVVDRRASTGYAGDKYYHCD